MPGKATLLIGTNNPGKLGEYIDLLVGVDLELIRPVNLGLQLEIDESGSTYRENARIKAIAFSLASGLPALADDSGIELAAFGGWPGIHSVRFAGPSANDADRRDAVLARLAEDQQESRLATFVCAIAIAIGPNVVAEGVGRLPGTIAPNERGAGGFGYDPIFIPFGENRTVAELSPTEKNRISHRAKAVETILPWLRKQFGN